MPWKSIAQARWGHSVAGVKALGGQGKVAEWDAATPKGSLKKKLNVGNMMKRLKPSTGTHTGGL